MEYALLVADEETAAAAGYRPCSRCMPKEYAQWKQSLNDLATKKSFE